jgi:hypothetical protein
MGIDDRPTNRQPIPAQLDFVVDRNADRAESIQEIDYDDVFNGCSIYCEMIVTPQQARRKTVAACQTVLTKRCCRARRAGGRRQFRLARGTPVCGSCAASARSSK